MRAVLGLAVAALRAVVDSVISDLFDQLALLALLALCVLPNSPGMSDLVALGVVFAAVVGSVAAVAGKTLKCAREQSIM
ncbi:MAG: hypothetical protein ACRDHZ_22815 [Ktedonobacteraceae bacterium]